MSDEYLHEGDVESSAGDRDIAGEHGGHGTGSVSADVGARRYATRPSEI